MDIIEVLYQREFKSINYNVRKARIVGDKALLLGPRGSGKSTLIFDHLSDQKKGSFLYIDLDDFRLKGVDLSKNLNSFINNNQISLLVLENFDFSFELPFCNEIIITSNYKCEMNGFKKIEIFPLDFEEFLAFEKRDLNIEATFNNFASLGTLPAMRENRSNFTKNYQSYINTIYANDQVEMAILKLLSSNQGRTVSMIKIFSRLKNDYKISKDRFYEFIKNLQNKYILFLVEKYGSSKSTKKIYLIDFTIRSALSFDKDFVKRFENIIFLELMKRKIDIFYTDGVDFYLPDEQKAILTIPFLPLNFIKSKLERLENHFFELGIEKVEVITMGEAQSFDQNGITYELLPFWNFATSL
jgi:predicted AAA+ superfamily ATPase